MPDALKQRFLYIFLDEAGNLDFSKQGTKYFVLGGITKERPFHAYKELTEFKYDQVEHGTALEYFHASENAQAVRNGVFDIIEKNLAGVAIDAIIVEKQKVDAALRDEEQFYPKVLGTLLRGILQHYPLAEFTEIIVFTDSLPVQRKRAAVEKGVKTTLAAMLPATVRYRVLHHASKSNMDLQIADYCTWAIYRKWNGQDIRSFRRVQAAVRSEWDVLQSGTEFPN
ncbi:MAG TPA: DUF3800 domain-containing protein [Verrucomicrobiae bacterium]|nr:DUF3800 domain-containing protein [Verrucomicrobiae bacterium]